MTPLLLALLLTSAPAADSGTAGPPMVLLKLGSLGFDDAEADQQMQHLERALESEGLSLDAQKPALDTACLEDAACVADAIGDDAGGLLVELTRIGPLVQVQLAVYRPDGTVLAEQSRSFPTEEVLSRGAPFSDDVKSALSTLRVDAEAKRPPPLVGASTTESEPITSHRWVTAAMGITGIGATVIGMLGTAGFASLALSQSLVLEDASSLGTEKETARIVGIAALAGAGLSVGVIFTGVAMMGSALLIDPTRDDDEAEDAPTLSSDAPLTDDGEGEPSDTPALDVSTEEPEPTEAEPSEGNAPVDDDPEPSDAPMGGTEPDAPATDDATAP